MSQETTVKKAAYAAIGIPVHAADSFRRRIDSTKSRAQRWGEHLSEATQSTIQECMEEGEQVIDSVSARVRARFSDVEETVRDGSETAREVGRGIGAVATKPIVSVESIDGVGPTYAEKLAAAGVTSTRALVERCDSSDAVERLARQADISSALISAWLDEADLSRINGIGPEHMSLLNAAGIGTIQQIAELDTAELHGRIRAANGEFGFVAGDPRFDHPRGVASPGRQDCALKGT